MSISIPPRAIPTPIPPAIPPTVTRIGAAAKAAPIAAAKPTAVNATPIPPRIIVPALCGVTVCFGLVIATE